MIIGNKCDLVQYREVTTDRGRAMADEFGKRSEMSSQIVLDTNVSSVPHTLVGATE
jgi:hypothetical protein